MSKNRIISHEILVIQDKTHKTLLRAHSVTSLFVRKWRTIISSRKNETLYKYNKLSTSKGVLIYVV